MMGRARGERRQRLSSGCADFVASIFGSHPRLWERLAKGRAYMPEYAVVAEIVFTITTPIGLTPHQ
jgi:hypothetical protein